MNISELKVAARLSAESYNKESAIHVHDTGIDLSMIVENGKLYVVFAGSTLAHGMEDWRTNLDNTFTTLDKSNNLTGHKGFLTAYESIEEHLTDIKQEVIFCGHSSGGALAQISQVIHSLRYPNIRSDAYTFGAPRWFSSIEGKLSNNIIRIENRGDVVPKIPPRVSGFKNLGTQYYLTNNGRVYSNPSTWELLFRSGFVSLNTHSMDVYYEKIEKLF